MKAFKTRKFEIVIVNAKMAYAVFLGAASYLIYPTSMEYYGFGLLSIFAGLAAAGLAINAFRQITGIREYENDQDKILALGNPVKSSTLRTGKIQPREGVNKHVK